MSIKDSEKGSLPFEGKVAPVVVASQADVAAVFLAEVAQRPDAAELLADYTPEEERAVKRKIDWILVPLLLIALMMGAVDKVALSTAAVFGIRKDLGLVGQDYSWSSSIIFFGSLATLFPALFLMQKVQAGRFIAINVLCWGILSMCIAATHNFGGLAALRFILGAFEAITFPGFGLVISMYWTRAEAVWRTALIYSTLSSLTNGVLSWACSFITTIAPWKILFILVGGLTILSGVSLFLWLPNNVTTARWLTDRQKVIAIRRLKENHTGIENKTIKMSQVKEALLDPKSWLLLVINFCLCVPNGGANGFNSIIIASLGFTPRVTVLLSIPNGLISWFAALIFSYIAIKTQRRAFCAMAAAVFPVVSSALLHTIPRSNINGSLGALYLIYFYWPPYVLMTTLAYANTGGYTKKTVVYGLSYCGYLAGNLTGPQVFLAKEAPGYRSGIIAMLACYVAAIVLIFVYYLWIVRLNRQKAKFLEEHPEVLEQNDLLDEWHDATDFENPKFVYVM